MPPQQNPVASRKNKPHTILQTHHSLSLSDTSTQASNVRPPLHLVPGRSLPILHTLSRRHSLCKTSYSCIHYKPSLHPPLAPREFFVADPLPLNCVPLEVRDWVALVLVSPVMSFMPGLWWSPVTHGIKRKWSDEQSLLGGEIQVSF